jgi:hypothetical protein
MTPEGQRLLSLGEFATAVGVSNAVLQRRLNGNQGAYWRETLGAVGGGAAGKGELRIPAASVDVWHAAVPQPARIARSGKRRAQPQGREQGSRAARPGVNETLMALPRRAETVDRDVLRRTFVDVGQLGHLLTSPNHQVIFGRRGTGKTHALATLASRVADRGDITVAIDFRRIGSTGAYGSRSTALDQRGTQLLVDVLAAVHGDLVDLALADTDTGGDADPALLARLDALADAISTVQVVGMVERTGAHQHTDTRESGTHLGLTLDPRPGLSVTADDRRARSNVFEQRIVESGTPLLDVNFGAVTRHFEDIGRCLAPRRIWILLDEWSSLPIELQPVLADFLRRALLAVPGVIVKIAAIEDRSHFRVALPDGDHMGLELGADITADIDLDDYMVFSNDDSLAVGFFSELLAQHVAPHLEEERLERPEAFVKAAFGSWRTFQELVRAAEGVPRDAINIAGLAAQRAANRTIGVSDIKAAARDWYLRDKEGALKRPEARELLARIIDEVVGRRHARAFLLERGSRGSEDFAVRELYDARVLHIIRRGITTADRPSRRYDGFVVDYGCYVDFSVPSYAKSSEFWRAGVPPDRFARIASSVVDLGALRSAD